MASGAILIQIDFLAPPSPAHVPFEAQTVGFCTGDADFSTVSIDGKGTQPLFRRGYLSDSVHASNSGDISQGRGFLASAIDGGFTLADFGDGLYSPSWMISNGAAVAIGATVHIGYITSGGVVTRLAQLVIVDHEIGAGVVEFRLKSPTYNQDSKIFGVRATTALLTSATDPDNPTDPATLVSREYAQFAGVGFGVNPTLKVNPPVPVSKVCWWKYTGYKGGGITGSGVTVANLVGTTADVVSQFIPVSGGYTDLPTTLLVKCRSSTDATNLVVRIDALRAAGYRIVLSDGRWFLDLDSYTPYTGYASAWNGEFVSPVSNNIFYTAGKAYGCDGFLATPLSPWVWFNWNQTQYEQNIPGGGIDPTRVSVYAVPRSISIAAQQATLNGFVSGNTVVPVPGSSNYANGIEGFAPLISSAESFVAADYVRNLKLYYDTSFTVPADIAAYALGAIEDTNRNGSSLLALAGGGSLESVVTDPTIGWDGTSTLAYFQGMSTPTTEVDAKLTVNARLSSTESRADFYVVESTWKSVVTAAGTISGVFGAVGIADPITSRSYPVSGASTYTLKNTAARTPGYPRWKSSAESLAELQNSALPHPVTRFYPNPGLVFQTLRMDLYECFVWGYTSVSFSSIYAGISPWWSPAKKTALSARGTTVICGAGKGEVANGRISWTAWTLPPYANEARAEAVSSAMGSTDWLIVGRGDTSAPTYWRSGSSGSTWTPGRFSGSGTVMRSRWIPALGSGGAERFLVTFNDGTMKHSTDTISWTSSPLALGFPLTDIAASIDPDTGGVLFVFVGGTGAVYWSNNLTSFTSVGPGAGAGTTYSVEYWSGYFYLGCAAGQIYRATPSQLKAGTWSNIPTGGSSPGDVLAFAGSASSLVASAWSAGTKRLYATDNGTTWREALDTIDMRPSTDYATIWSSDLVFVSSGSERLFVYAEGSQIITSADVEQGATAYAPQWTPEQTDTPGSAIARIRGDWLKGMGWNYNPIRISYGGGAYQMGEAFALGVNPPESNSAETGQSATEVVSKICQERWVFAGEMAATRLDGSRDAIHLDFPVVNLGAVQDAATILSIQYAPIGSEYTGRAYTKNVDVAYSAGNDGFYFGGWGDATMGKAVWDACRAAYLKSGCLRPLDLTFDTVPDGMTLGAMWTGSDADIGARIAWAVDRPRYVDIVVDGNDSAAAQAFSGCRYKLNQTILAGRGLTISGTGYGIVVNADHDYITGEHSLTVAFPPA